MKLMCDLNRMLVGSREFSYEEIRRQIYEKSGKFPATINSVASTTTFAPLAPSTPSSLLRSGGKKKTPLAPLPPPVFKIPLMNQPPPPLKSNEKWHCNIDSLYRHSDGSELSFEQVRAAHYHNRAPVRVKVEEMSVPPPPSAPLKKETCEMACQTDLCGLDFDIQLVPRVPQAQSEPPSAEKSNGPSPTVNTKQALSSVKSWFNSSVLLPSAPQAPAKKSLFAIFKDPSMVEVVDHCPPPLPAPKPFAIFTEEDFVDQENAAPPQCMTKLKQRRPLVAIEDDENSPPKVEEQVEQDDDFKENQPPTDHQAEQSAMKRQLSGILQTSIGIPCDPDAENGGQEEEDAAPSAHVSRALFIEEDDQTRYYSVPVVKSNYTIHQLKCLN